MSGSDIFGHTGKGEAPRIAEGRERGERPPVALGLLGKGELLLAVGCSTRGGELAKCCTYCRVIEAALRACRIEFKTIFIDLMDKHDMATQK